MVLTQTSEQKTNQFFEATVKLLEGEHRRNVSKNLLLGCAKRHVTRNFMDVSRDTIK